MLRAASPQVGINPNEVPALVSNPSSVATGSAPFIFWDLQATVDITSNSNTTFLAIGAQITHQGSAAILGSNHIVGVYGHCTMDSPTTLPLAIALEGKIDVEDGTITQAESCRNVLSDVSSGDTITLWYGSHSKITDCHGTVTAAAGFQFDVATVSGSAIGTMRGYVAADVSTSFATNYSAFVGQVAAASNHWNIDISGTANNRIAGSTKFGANTAPVSLIDIAAGTTSVAPLNLTAGTNLTTASAGAVEFDGKAFYASAAASSRQVVVTEQLAANVADLTLVNGTGAQAWLAVANDTLTVQASNSYFFDAIIEIEDMGAVSRTISLLFGGTATYTSIGYSIISWNGANNAGVVGQVTKFAAIATASAATAAATTAASTIVLKGIMRINGAGTVIPQLQFDADPTGTILCKKNSFFKLYPFGADTAAAVGNWA